MINTKKWCEANITEKALELINDGNVYKFVDQDLLNILLENKTLLLPIKFNTKIKISIDAHQEKNIKPYTVILHYISQNNDCFYVDTSKNILVECIKIINKLPLSNIAKLNYVLVMNATYLESVLKSNKLNQPEAKESLIKELDLVKILIRIYINSKSNISKNICYVLKFTKQYPTINIINNYFQYSALEKF